MTSEELFDAVNDLWEVHDDPEADVTLVGATTASMPTDTLASFTRFVCETFANDPTAPSVIVSWLMEQKQFYVSIRRYTGKYAEGGWVVCNTQADSLAAALDELAARVSRLVPPKVGDTVFTVRPHGDGVDNVIEWIVVGVGGRCLRFHSSC